MPSLAPPDTQAQADALVAFEDLPELHALSIDWTAFCRLMFVINVCSHADTQKGKAAVTAGQALVLMRRAFW